MLNRHKEKGADVTIAVFNVPMEEAGRYGIMSTDENGKIFNFTEKPEHPSSTLASMGVYIFSWKILKDYLTADEADPASTKDFGKDVIPAMLKDGLNMYAYAFEGYWKDVGTVYSLWEANMDMLGTHPLLNLYDEHWSIYSRNEGLPGHYISSGATVKNCCITEGCKVYGTVEHSVLFSGAVVEEGAVVRDSIVLPYTVIRKGARVNKAVISNHCIIGPNAVVGSEEPNVPWVKSKICTHGITLIGDRVTIGPGIRIGTEMMVEQDILGGGRDE